MKHIFPAVTLGLMFLTSCSLISGLSSKIVPKASEPSRPIVAQSAPESDSTGIAGILKGNWLITAVDTVEIEGETEEEMPYIHFDEENHQFYASNGCNVLNGSFMTEGNRVMFANVLSTMKLCADVEYDGLISTFLADGVTATAEFQGVGKEGYVTLTAGHRKMSLRRHGMDFLNGNWQVIEINGEDIDDEEANIFFDIAARRVHGNTGCNFFNGEIVIDPTQSNAVSFEKMGVTKRMCQKHDQERNMMLALEAATLAVPGDDGTALLTGPNNKYSLKLRRLAVER